MSFNNVLASDLETNTVASAHYRDFPEFEEISRSIESTLHHINNTQLAAIKNIVREYESLRNSEQPQNERLRSISRKFIEITGKCTESFKGINDKTKQLNTYLNECESNHEDEDTLKYLRQKEAISLNLVRGSLRQFQNYLRKVKAFEKEFLDKGHAIVDTAFASADADASLVAYNSKSEGQRSEQAQVQITYEPVNAEELEQQSLMIEEREREIQQISQDTREINEIFLNLQDIIQEQQFQVDSIEDNILSYSSDAQGASRELRRADRYQRRSSGRMLCCLLILIGVFGSVILIGVVL